MAETRIPWFAQRPHPTDKGMIQVQTCESEDAAKAQIAAWGEGYYWEHPDIVRERLEAGPMSEQDERKVEELERKLEITEGDYQSMYDTAAAAVQRAEAAEARVQALETALRDAVDTIREWHDTGLSGTLQPQAWALYQQSPEMKRITAALTEPRREEERD